MSNHIRSHMGELQSAWNGCYEHSFLERMLENEKLIYEEERCGNKGERNT